MTFFNAEGYARLMGRWSQRLAPRFLEFVRVDDGDAVLDLGCGTGSLANAVATTWPKSKVTGIDPSAPAVEYARKHAVASNVHFDVGDAVRLPYPGSSFDKTMSLLVVNHLPDVPKAMMEMRRVTRPGGGLAAAVWDYGEGMTMFRTFWDAAVKLDPAAESRHQRHAPYSRRGQLSSLWNETGLQDVRETSLTIPLTFSSFNDFFDPFLAGVSPSGSYVAGLAPDRRSVLEQHLREELLGTGPDRPITMQARAWAVKGTVPEP